jgi:hypothetical protein
MCSPTTPGPPASGSRHRGRNTRSRSACDSTPAYRPYARRLIIRPELHPVAQQGLQPGPSPLAVPLYQDRTARKTASSKSTAGRPARMVRESGRQHRCAPRTRKNGGGCPATPGSRTGASPKPGFMPRSPWPPPPRSPAWARTAGPGPMLPEPSSAADNSRRRDRHRRPGSRRMAPDHKHNRSRCCSTSLAACAAGCHFHCGSAELALRHDLTARPPRRRVVGIRSRRVPRLVLREP